MSSTVAEGSCAAGHASPSRDRNPAPSAPLIQGTKPGGIDPFGRRRRLPRTICHHIANQHIGLGTRHSRPSQIPQSPRSAPQFQTLLRALPNMFLRAVTARDAAMNSDRPVRIRWHPAGHGAHSSTPGKTFDHTASDSSRGGRVVIGSYRPRSSPWKPSLSQSALSPWAKSAIRPNCWHSFWPRSSNDRCPLSWASSPQPYSTIRLPASSAPGSPHSSARTPALGHRRVVPGHGRVDADSRQNR